LALTSHNNSSLCTAIFDNMTAPNWPPPTAPTGLNALAAAPTQVNLMWNAFANATSYNVKRSATSGGPYTVVFTGVTTTSFADVGLVPGVKYYYVVSAVVGGVESPNSAEASAAGQRGWLKFDESSGTIASDCTGNGWNGALVNATGATNWVAGKFGNALDLNGASQYVSLPNGVVNSLADFTIAVWVNLDAASTWSRVFDFGSGTATNMFLTANNGSVARFALKAGGGEQIIDGLSPLPTNVWTHVAVTLSGGTGILYVDGVEAGRNSSVTLTPSSMGGTTQNYLGKSQYGDPYLNGALDEFRIYSAALSPAEIAAIAAVGPDQLPNTNGPSLSLAVSGTNLTVSWPAANVGYTLQSRTNLVLGNWMNVASPAPQLTGGQWQVALPLSGNADSIFYRLVK
jgi:hypothetical protein